MEQLKYVAYLRADKDRGSKTEFSRQLRIIKKYVLSKNGVIIGVFKEVATGTNIGRLELSNAIRFQGKKDNKGSILIAITVDVITQELSHAEMMLKHHKFIVCEAPEQNEFIIRILAIVAHHRRVNQYGVYKPS